MPCVLTFFLGGEIAHKTLVKEAVERFPNTSFYNCYGASETTSDGPGALINNQTIDDMDEILPIGPKDFEYCYIVDENGKRIIDDNETGELIIDAGFVASGYYKLPELTSERFFLTSKGNMAFKTGDFACYKNDYIYVLGRKDKQVKIGGNRVEIDDVESHMSKCDIVEECAVDVKKDENNVNSLVALVVLNDAGLKMKNLEAFISIKKQMLSMVEGYKVPSKIMFVKELPKNNNDKLDRQCIKKMIADSK